MNYVAHQVLSFSRPAIQLGNLLGEVVKGRKYEHYPSEVQQGILLHRFIDTFTDSHPLVHQSTKLLHHQQGKYAPIVVDVLFDYFLIKHWDKFVNEEFSLFKNNCYTLFQANTVLYPTRLNEILHYMLKYDWFLTYSTLEGVSKTLKNISKRTRFENQLSHTEEIIQQNLENLEENFLLFYPELEKNCHEFLFG